MHERQLAFQILSFEEGGAFFVTCFVVPWRAEIALCIERVLELTAISRRALILALINLGSLSIVFSVI